MTGNIGEAQRIDPADPRYPRNAIHYFGADAPPLEALGATELLDLDLLGFFSSIRTPPQLILGGLEIARSLRAEGIPLIGGFQAPLERECLALLLRGTQPLVICLTRGLLGMRIPRSWRAPLESKRLLVLSPFPERRRPTVLGGAARNRVVSALASRILVVNGRVGSRTYRIAADAIDRGKAVFCLEDRANSDLLMRGARPATMSALREGTPPSG
jgi:predicted Rossmann fold nucleotide-binding protein DprA/Smf involved in DNA uptake